MIRVFLLDDHELVRRGLVALLKSAGDLEVVGESGSVRGAVDHILSLRPDVAVLDGRLPDGSGIDVCRDIRSADPSIKTLILTSYEEDEAMFNAVMGGAAGYVLKEVRGGDIVDGIRRVASGQTLLDPGITQQVLDRLRPRIGQEFSELALLTRQQRRVLELITDGLTNRQISEQLLLTEKTVKNYVSQVFAKLGVQHRTQAALLANRFANAQARRSSASGG
ncbi:response regulator transcription factor [Kineosporia sp. NBRC 101731]|uniref:response regulator n=1 Tax=Kineosporia sp. NBRC 101731 TaxID=3032199 RepID=UPI0024A10337|nr:response regulator transcription factor [Kineosporia sp. NBRC 101731]GLY29703.1 DNA-binding response regulator [Kineosporia sp. NBRC 101731]